MDTAEKRTLKSFLLIMGGFLIYAALHFTLVDYRGQKILVITPEPFNRNGGEGSVIGSYTLETEYGPIKLSTLAKIGFHDHDRTLYSIKTGHYTISHDLRYLDVKLPKDVSVAFSYYTGKIIYIGFKEGPIEMAVGNVPLKVRTVNMQRKPSEPELSFDIYDYDREIELSDGTKIHFIRDVFALRLYQDGVWQLGNRHPDGTPDWKTFLVTFPGEEEGKAYGSVRFRENWGPFVDGELTVEQESTLF